MALNQIKAGIEPADPTITDPRLQVSFSGYEQNHFFHNRGDGRFSELGGIAGLASTADGRGWAPIDIENRGALDIVLRNFNRDYAQVFRNHAARGNWLQIKLVGTRSNRDAIGARVSLKASTGQQTQELACGSGHLSCASKRLHFGLGDAETVAELTVRWPSGATQTFVHVPANQIVTLTEGAAEISIAPARGQR